MNRMRRAAYAVAGITSTAALLLAAPWQASAVTYTYTIKNPTHSALSYTIKTYDANNVQLSEAGPLTIGPGETKQWLQTNDGGHISTYHVAWTLPGNSTCNGTHPYSQEAEAVELPEGENAACVP